MFIDKRRVEFHQTDMAGIVHFSEFFRYLEAAEHAFFRSLGLSVAGRDGERLIGWPRVSCSFDYMKPLRFEDEFEVRLRIEKVGNSSLSLIGDIYKGDVLAATGRSTSVCCGPSPSGGMQKISIPEGIRGKLEAAASA